MNRRILHIDMDAFFASVEQARDPSLRGKPLIIGGNKTDLRGVVSTATYEAREFGVRSAMPLAQAKRLCPHGIFMRGNHALYRDASRKVRAILESITPLVEAASIDEAYLDISGSLNLFAGDEGTAMHIKKRIREELSLPCTIAIASNKLIAKVATEFAKPDGYISVPQGTEAEFLRPLPIRKLPGVGPRTCESLERFDVRTIGDLATMPQEKLLRTLGSSALGLQRAAKGISTSEVTPHGVSKSISRETTFETDITNWERVERVGVYLAERAVHALRDEGLHCKCVGLKIRYADFETKTFAQSLPEPTCIDGDVIRVLRTLFPKARQRSAPIRLIGVSLTSLSESHQLQLFEENKSEKWERVMKSVDDVRERHGFEFIRTAKTMRSKQKKD
ncbi:MAG: DNA polymerase IV [Candidatus Hydrogenedentes bacterium]|nr:DNA polymerase IV [Candidatus Hydrogenedentota bacterium]